MIELNPYAAAKREEKASKIARLLRDAGASVEVAAALDAAGRRAIEEAAGVKPGSEETWTLTLGKLARMLNAQRSST